MLQAGLSKLHNNSVQKDIPFAFASTNSTTQGVQVPLLFKALAQLGKKIAFTHKTFRWDAQSTDNAKVHVVIIGFSNNPTNCLLYSYLSPTSEPILSTHPHINGYLVPSDDIYIAERSQSIETLSKLEHANFGSMPRDGGNLILQSEEEYAEGSSDPVAAQYIHQYVGSDELIHDKKRWCLWLPAATPSEIKKSPFLSARVKATKDFRLKSPAKSTQKMAETSWLFGQDGQPTENYICIPRVFSERREYATCAYFTPNIITSDACFTCVDPSGLAFAVIESKMFMVWQKTIGGRLESRCRFSNTLVWNNLPLPSLSGDIKDRLILAGKNILDVRSHYPDSSLADLYDPDVMPADLRTAHKELDKIADVAFGAPHLCANDTERSEILMRNFRMLTKTQK